MRSETAVGSSSVSIASVAVELAKKIFGTLQGKNVFIVGAGKMSELAARHLLAHGCASIFVANRTYDRAIGLAEKFNGQAIKFDDLYDSCDRADIVITSTGAPHAIFRREHGEQFLARRKNKPMFFIDIAVPRDVSPEMASKRLALSAAARSAPAGGSYARLRSSPGVSRFTSAPAIRTTVSV